MLGLVEYVCAGSNGSMQPSTTYEIEHDADDRHVADADLNLDQESDVAQGQRGREVRELGQKASPCGECNFSCGHGQVDEKVTEKVKQR